MQILGIDPGLHKTGWALIEKINSFQVRLIKSGCVITNPKLDLPTRLVSIEEGLSKLIKELNPSCSAMEEVYVNKNPQSTLKLSHARGAIMVCLKKNGLDVAEYAPKLVKKSVTSNGNSQKDQMANVLKILFPKLTYKYEDETDALAVAYCHAMRVK